jgi:pre-mRNA-splicing factor SYF1
VLDIGLKFAAIERKLGEIDRSRSILMHLSQFCDPSKQENINAFWNIWKDFEQYHGNADTYAEMHRIQRSVAARYSLNAPLFIADNKLPI